MGSSLDRGAEHLKVGHQRVELGLALDCGAGAPELPKTRSGKIMRRLLRDIANGQPLGDTTTLADSTVVETIKASTGKED